MPESVIFDVRYALRGIRSSPLFATSVAGTIGLGLGILCSAFTIVNAYLLKPIDLPDPHALYSLSWDTAAARRHGFRLSDFEALRDRNPVLSDVAAGEFVTVMQNGLAMTGQLVTGNYFQLLGARPAMGRTLIPDDAATPGVRSVVVLSHDAWRTRYGADPAIVGKEIALGRGRYHVVGVMPRSFIPPGDETVAFWAPLTMADAFAVTNPWREPDVYSLAVMGRLRRDATESQLDAWLDAWLRQRFPVGSDAAPLRVRLDSRATRIPLTPATLTMLSLIVAAFGLVLLVACANVMNMMLARAIGRQREIGVRLSLGASRGRVMCQLIIESLMLAVPAAAFGLAMTVVTARVFPTLILGTLPEGLPSAANFLAPLDPDIRVLGLLLVAAVGSAVLVGLSPAAQITRMNLVLAARGEFGADMRVSRLRTGLVAMQIGTCVLFVVGASGLLDESRRLAHPETGLEYEQVVDVRVAADLRADVAARLASDPAVERVAASWRPPLAGSLHTVRLVPSGHDGEQPAGFMAVSPEYFEVFAISLVRGRVFTAEEADRNDAVVVVSEAAARKWWHHFIANQSVYERCLPERCLQNGVSKKRAGSRRPQASERRKLRPPRPRSAPAAHGVRAETRSRAS